MPQGRADAKSHVDSQCNTHRSLTMTRYNQVAGSGDGTRPTTDGAADNIGAGEKFTTRKNAEGEEVSGGPAPQERMQQKRKDVEGTRKDDSAAFGLTEDPEPSSNEEPETAKPTK